MTFARLVEYVTSVLEPVVPLIMTMSLAVFVWGMAVYITKTGDIKEAERGKKLMLYGVLAFFVMTTVWGLVLILERTFSPVLRNDQTVDVDSLFEW